MLCGELTRYRPARRTKSGAGLHAGKANGYERDEKAYFEDCTGDWIDSGGRGMWTLEVRVHHRTGIGPSNSGTDGRCGSRQSGAVEEIFRGRCHYFDEKGRAMDKAAPVKDVSPMPAGYSGLFGNA
jgi:hypothetical protein